VKALQPSKINIASPLNQGAEVPALPLGTVVAGHFAQAPTPQQLGNNADPTVQKRIGAMGFLWLSVFVLTAAGAGSGWWLLTHATSVPSAFKPPQLVAAHAASSAAAVLGANANGKSRVATTPTTTAAAKPMPLDASVNSTQPPPPFLASYEKIRLELAVRDSLDLLATKSNLPDAQTSTSTVQAKRWVSLKSASAPGAKPKQTAPKALLSAAARQQASLKPLIQTPPKPLQNVVPKAIAPTLKPEAALATRPVPAGVRELCREHHLPTCAAIACLKAIYAEDADCKTQAQTRRQTEQAREMQRLSR
jgi:hypothetical protein